MDDKKIATMLNDIYHQLFQRFGPQYWWPAETPFEVMIGAVLTQSCSWKNVEKAIINLKEAKLLTVKALRVADVPTIATAIHSTGYYNAKTRKLKALVTWLEKQCKDGLEELFARDALSLRQSLLKVHGIGPETADSILLYAAAKPVFVIDAYTKRSVRRLGLKPADDSYDGYQKLFMNNLSKDVLLYNEYHSLLVRLGKEFCLKNNPSCGHCPLSGCCHLGKEVLTAHTKTSKIVA